MLNPKMRSPSEPSETTGSKSLSKRLTLTKLPGAEKKYPPHIKQVRALTQDIKPILGVSVVSKLDGIPDWAKPEVEVHFHVSKKGVMSKDPLGPVMKAKSVGVVDSVMKQFSKMTLSQIHHYALLGSYINELYRVHKFTDVIIVIDGQVFAANRHALSCHSQLFSELFVGTNIPPFAISEVTMFDINKSLFDMFLHFVYFGEIMVDKALAPSLMNLSEILKSDTLKAKINLYITLNHKMTLKEAVLTMNSYTEHPISKLAAINTLIDHYQEVIAEPRNFKYIQFEDMQKIICSNDLGIRTEIDAFWSVLYWIAFDRQKRVDHLVDLMSHVRFTTMSTLELMDCARASKLMSFSKQCKNMLVNAHWISYSKEMGMADPLILMQKEHPRNFYLAAKEHYEPSVQEFDRRYIAYKEITKAAKTEEKERQEKLRSSSISSSQETTEKQTAGLSLFNFGFMSKKDKKDKNVKPTASKKVNETQPPPPTLPPLLLPPEVKTNVSISTIEPEPEEKQDGPTPILNKEEEEEIKLEINKSEEDKKKAKKLLLKKRPDIKLNDPAKPKASATHEFRNGKWKRKRQRGKKGMPMGMIDRADLDLDSDSDSESETDKSGRSKSPRNNSKTKATANQNESAAHYYASSGSGSSLLDRTDSDMSRHLYPVLKPLHTVTPKLTLTREGHDETSSD